LLNQTDTINKARLHVVCDNDPALFERVYPFAALLRDDSNGYPVVITTGSVFVTEGTDRRRTGTHYTPPSLTESLVQHALEPLVYKDMAAGVEPSPATLRMADELLALKICDPACGSGAFLVQSCRYLADKLVEAWKGNPPDDLPSDDEECRLYARRLVADQCLYGVDLNPMAVEMAKLSLWLITMQKNKPFSFLDHAIRSGDSLLGISSSEQIE
jgi:type II restriction/modification system DNA methylase subunit YeeA